MYDSEHYLFNMLHKNYKAQFPNLIDRSGYNRRRKKLFHLKQRVRCYLVNKMAYGEDTFIIDSMPIPICQSSRANIPINTFIKNLIRIKFSN